VFERYAREALVAQDLAGPPVDAPLLDLAHVRLAELLDEAPASRLDELLTRLFDPRERDLLTVCAFSSAL
jgi:hypothetical protein